MSKQTHPPGDGGVDRAGAAATFAALIRRHGLRESYGAAVDAEVEALLANPGLDDPGLDDRTALPFVTIDNHDSMDLDQALLIERAPSTSSPSSASGSGGGYLVHYALADASYYVPAGGALFDEALERGVSYYLPGHCVPMLPRALSEGIVSLNPDVDRRALLFTIALDAKGEVIRTDVARAKIRSRGKLTYDGVQALYDEPAASPLLGQPYTESLMLLAEVGRLRQAEARARGVIPFDRVNLDVVLTGDGRLRVEREGRNDASRYNEQISLLCNIEGARLLCRGVDAEAQPVYRVHDAPDEKSLRHLEQVIASVVALHGLDGDDASGGDASGGDASGGNGSGRWRWRRGEQSLASYLEGLPGASTEHRAIRAAVERQILIANRRSEFVAEPGRHYALGVSPYSRFSSPMREVVGIFTHKEALEKLELVDPSQSPAADEALRAQVIRAANRAKERQRQLTKAVFALALDQRFGAELALPEAKRAVYRGKVLGLRATRVYLTVDEPPLELKVAVADLEPTLGAGLALDDEQPARLTAGTPDSELRLGDTIELRVARRDDRGRWRFALLAPPRR